MPILIDHGAITLVCKKLWLAEDLDTAMIKIVFKNKD